MKPVYCVMLCCLAIGVFAAPALSHAPPKYWWPASKAEDHLETGYRAADPSELQQLEENLGFAEAALANADTPTAQLIAKSNVAEAKSELAQAQRGYPVDLAICSGRGVSKVVLYQEVYRVFRCRMSLTSNTGYVSLWGTLHVRGLDRYSVTNVVFAAG